MNARQIRIFYGKLEPWLKLFLLTLAALGGLAFAGFLSQRIISWHVSYFRNLAILRSPLPVAEERNTAESPAKGKNQEKETAAMGSYAAPENARKTWNWPDDLSLAKKALSEFSRARKWDTALFIGANLGRDTVFQDEVFQLVEHSYLAHAGNAVDSERKEMREQQAENTLFNRAAFLVNFRIRVEENVRIASIAEIMTASYFESVSDPFVKWLACNPVWLRRRTPVRYGNEAEAEFRSLIGGELDSMGYYMKTRWDFFRAWLARNKELAAALAALTATERQRDLMQELSSKERTKIDAGEYAVLPPVWQWFSGKAAIAAFAPDADVETLGKVFSGNVNGIEWITALKKGVRISPDVRAFFRSRPRWLEAVNARNYDAAMVAFQQESEILIPDGKDTSLESDLKNMLALEKSLMEEYFPESAWKEECKRKTETRASAKLNSMDFIDIVKRFLRKIPETQIDAEQKKAFLALCHLNRGKNGRSIYLLAETTNESLIKHNIPAEELNNE